MAKRQKILMIRMKVMSRQRGDEISDHFVLSFERPGSVEAMVVNGVLVVHVYDQPDSEEDKDLIGAYDGHLPPKRLKNWEA